MSAPIDLQATFIPNEGEFFRVKLALEIAIDEVKNEPGCIRYELTEATEEKLVLTEQWASEEDLEKHSKGTAVQDLNESLSALLAEPVKVERISPSQKSLERNEVAGTLRRPRAFSGDPVKLTASSFSCPWPQQPRRPLPASAPRGRAPLPCPGP